MLDSLRAFNYGKGLTASALFSVGLIIWIDRGVFLWIVNLPGLLHLMLPPWIVFPFFWASIISIWAGPTILYFREEKSGFLQGLILGIFHAILCSALISALDIFHNLFSSTTWNDTGDPIFRLIMVTLLIATAGIGWLARYLQEHRGQSMRSYFESR